MSAKIQCTSNLTCAYGGQCTDAPTSSYTGNTSNRGNRIIREDIDRLLSSMLALPWSGDSPCPRVLLYDNPKMLKKQQFTITWERLGVLTKRLQILLNLSVLRRLPGNYTCVCLYKQWYTGVRGQRSLLKQLHCVLGRQRIAKIHYLLQKSWFLYNLERERKKTTHLN